jgi:hypothetical protein
MHKLIQQRRKYGNSTLIMTAVVMLALIGTAGASPVEPGVATPIWNGFNSVQVSGSCLNLYLVTPGTCPNLDQFILGSPSDAPFGTVAVTHGTTMDYLIANQASLSPGVQPYSGGTAFMTLNGFTFDVTAIVVPAGNVCPTSGIPAAGTTCAIEDLTIVQVDDSQTTAASCPGGVAPCGTVSVTFHSKGIGYVGTSATGSTPFDFSYTSQFNNDTIPDLLNKANAGLVTDSVSITATGANVPEPMAFSLMGLGLAAIGVYGRFGWGRRKRA